jgi:hypothetical protein
MTTNEAIDLKAQLKLIETMMSEGRQSTESWGWTFLLWGVAYYVAIAWSALGHGNQAWVVTMVVAAVLTGVIGSRISRGHPETTLGRAVGSIWQTMGMSLFIVLSALGLSGHYNIHVFMVVIGGMLAVANGTSSLILKWKMQFFCALVWLSAVSSVASGRRIRQLLPFWLPCSSARSYLASTP